MSFSADPNECSDCKQRIRLELLRRIIRSEGVRPVIKYRELVWHGVANNLFLGDTTGHQRSDNKETFFTLLR